MDVQPSKTRRLAVSSPYGNLRGIYNHCGCHEGKPAFTRVMQEGMDPAATTCIFFTSVFSCEPRWYFAKYLLKETRNACAMESFCSAPGDADCPETADWPCEDILYSREATEEDERNPYFFPGPSKPRGFDFDPGSRSQAGASMGKRLRVLRLTETDFNMGAVRAAYRRLALTLHPDRGGITAEFQALQNAYEALVYELNGESGTMRTQVATPSRQEQPETEPPDFFAPGHAAETTPELSKEEKDIRRERALEAALRRHRQTS